MRLSRKYVYVHFNCEIVYGTLSPVISLDGVISLGPYQSPAVVERFSRHRSCCSHTDYVSCDGAGPASGSYRPQPNYRIVGMVFRVKISGWWPEGRLRGSVQSACCASPDNNNDPSVHGQIMRVEPLDHGRRILLVDSAVCHIAAITSSFRDLLMNSGSDFLLLFVSLVEPVEIPHFSSGV